MIFTGDFATNKPKMPLITLQHTNNIDTVLDFNNLFSGIH